MHDMYYVTPIVAHLANNQSQNTYACA